MTTAVHCPKCEQNFSSTESYQNHLPCSGSKTYGGAGDVHLRKGKFEETEVGTGERR